MTNRIRPAYRVLLRHSVESGESYVFKFDVDRGLELLRVFGRFAADPKHEGFTWADAAKLSRQVRLVMECMG